MVEMLQVDDFRPHVGKVFHFKGTPFSMPLDHIVCDETRALPQGVKRRPFLLIFRAKREKYYMTENIYDCEVEGGPVYSLHVAPIQTIQSEFQDYQAAFN